ncbi:MAG: hypothetical protein GVY28_14170 [Alphaproteobacteria bacterium]|jgi:Rod binding domain-containing protein|nr:hypothetical protein [Alphaproteobacteria bacterium]
MTDSVPGFPSAAGIAPPPGSGSAAAANPALQEAAREFEAAFLAEMLAHGGLGETPEAFGGGAGEDQFAGMLRKAQARHLADAGGIGLAEYIVTSLARAHRDPAVR